MKNFKKILAIQVNSILKGSNIIIKQDLFQEFKNGPISANPISDTLH